MRTDRGRMGGRKWRGGTRRTLEEEEEEEEDGDGVRDNEGERRDERKGGERKDVEEKGGEGLEWQEDMIVFSSISFVCVGFRKVWIENSGRTVQPNREAVVEAEEGLLMLGMNKGLHVLFFVIGKLYTRGGLRK